MCMLYLVQFYILHTIDFGEWEKLKFCLFEGRWEDNSIMKLINQENLKRANKKNNVKDRWAVGGKHNACTNIHPYTHTKRRHDM